MTRLYNLYTKKPEEFSSKEAYNRLNLEQDKYAPIKDEKYFMENQEGKMQEVMGQNVYSSMGDGYKLQDEQTYAIRKQLRAENSQVGVFAKSAISEALTFGLYDDIVNAPKNPLEEEIKRNRQEMFGTAIKAGEVTGMIAPFALGGIGGLARLAGAGVIKTALRSGLKGAGKAPTALLVKSALKASQKVGEQAAKGVAKIGGGKKAQALAKWGAGSLAVVGLDAGVEGVKETAKQTRQAQLAAKDKDKSHYKFSQILGQGLDSATETFTGGAFFMAATGAFGGAAIGGAKLGVWGAKKIAEKVPDKLRKSFFNDKGIKNTITKFRETFRIGKSESDEKVFKKAAEAVKEEFKEGIPSTRKEFLRKTQLKKDSIGIDLGADRKFFKKLHDSYSKILGKDTPQARKVVNEEIYHTLNEGFERIKKIPKDLEKGVTAKGFISTINKLQSAVKKRFDNGILDFEDLYNTSKILADKGNLRQTTEKLSTAKKYFRQGYGIMSNAENKYIETISHSRAFKNLTKSLGKDFGNRFKNFTHNKRRYEVLSTFEEPMVDLVRKPMSPFSNFFLAREAMIAGGVGGIAMGRPGLALTALGAGAGLEVARRTGYKFLQTANKIDSTAKFMRKSKTVQGVTNLIEKPAAQTVLNSSALGLFFLGKPVKNMEEFDRELETLDPIDQITRGQEDLEDAVSEFGGGRNLNSFNNKLIDMKRFILQAKPIPKINSLTGKKHYDSLEEKVFFKKLSKVASPEGFVSAVRKGEMTHTDYKTFAGFYPEFATNFVVSLTQGVQEGKIKNKNVDQFLSTCKNSDSKELIYYQLDKMNQGSAMQTQPPKRKVNIKAYSEPSISERARSGML